MTGHVEPSTATRQARRQRGRRHLAATLEATAFPVDLSGVAIAEARTDRSCVSPELALVDPEIAALARTNLPQLVPETRESGSAPTDPSRRELVARKDVNPAPSLERAIARRRFVLGTPRLAAVAFVALTVLGGAAIVVPRDVGGPVPVAGSGAGEPGGAEPKRMDGRKPRIQGIQRAKPQSAARTTPAKAVTRSRDRKGARAEPRPAIPSAAASTTEAPRSRGRVLRWRDAPRATAYQVQLFRAEGEVLVRTVEENRFPIPRTWRHNGTTYRLEPGRYRWYVWAAVGGRWTTAPIARSAFTSA